jgi:hypothetical protein
MRLQNNKVLIDKALACFSYAIKLYQNAKEEHKPATAPRTLVFSGERRSASARRPERGPDVAICLENYALCLRAIDRSQEAEPLEARARAIRAKNA